MIYKELDPFKSEDKFAKAGRAAEEQMAFYFKRFFGSDPDILVLNGIRLEMEGDAAQIDHLVIHSHGMTIVESKSVHGKIQIKDDGQWIRWFNGNMSKGMASPVTQARLQEQFFRRALSKASNNPDVFERIPIDLLVAISDQGVIIWPQSGLIKEVCKADQVPDRMMDAMKARSASPSALELTKSNREKIAAFLVAANKPLWGGPELGGSKRIASSSATNFAAPKTAHEVTQATAANPSPVSGPHHECKHCTSDQLEIRYSFSYFFWCSKCEKNTAIKAACSKCGVGGKLRKQKKEFFVDCEACASPSLFFINP